MLLKISKLSLFRFCICVTFVLAAFGSINAQTDDEVSLATAKAVLYFQAGNYVEAIPYFETVLKANPNEPKVHFLYGFCLVAKSKQISDTAEAKQLSAKALEEFKTAKKLGLNDESNDALIKILSGEPSAGSTHEYSENEQAEKYMQQGESLYAQSKYDEAVKMFEKALAADPKLYQAGTSGGDCFTARGDWDNAEKWYQKAIAIDPNRETAYRYSATPFMKQKKYDQARDRYIEAYITEPYSQMSPRGIGQWAQITGAKLGHPVVDVPEATFDEKGKAVPKTAIKTDDPSAAPWLAYLATREAWKKDTFAKTFPNEKQYRHTLKEECEALRAAVKAAQEQKSPNKQFDLLVQLDKDGVLEAFVLMARADEGIAEDHADYLKNNRPKLRQYVLNYVIKK